MPEHGWTKTAIENGIEEMKLPKISAGIISNGPIDLVHHHYEKSNNLLGKINNRYMYILLLLCFYQTIFNE